MSFGGSAFNFSIPPSTTTGSGFPSFSISSSNPSTMSGGTLTSSQSSVPGGFNFNTPATTSVGVAAGQPVSLGGTNVSSSQTGIGTGGFSFGLPATSAVAAATTIQNTGSLINFTQPSLTASSQLSMPSTTSGFSFGNSPAVASSSQLSMPSTTSGFSFGNSPAVASTSNPLTLNPSPSTTVTAPASSTTTIGFSGFGSLTNKIPTTSTPSLFGSGTSAFSQTGSATAAAAATLSTSTTTSSFGGTGSGGGPNLSMRQLEEKLNKWLVELKEQEERFIRQAAHVNAWDQILQTGHDQVQTLKDTLHTVKSDQSRLEAELDFIRGQQEELERLLDPLESAVSSTPATQLHQGDRQRDNMYHLALNLDGQLRQMTDDLGKVIEHLNSNSGSTQANDPVSVVARILSAHMDTLKWVDQNTTLLSQKMEDLAKVTPEATKRG